MPTNKRSKKLKGQKTTTGNFRKRRTSLLENPNLKNAIYFILAALFAVGQVEIFEGHKIGGIVLSLVSAVAGFAIYFGINIMKAFEIKPASSGPIRKSKVKIVVSSKKTKFGGALSFKRFTPLSFLRGFGVLAALVLAGVGQWYWSQAGDASTFPKGTWFFLAAIILFIAGFWPWYREGLKKVSLDLKWEMVFLWLIAITAIFMRVYQIATVPSGLFIDQGFEGLAALRILNESWHPFYVEDVFHAYSLALNQLALWFKLFGAGEVSLKLFYVFLSLIGFPLVYWTFRQLAGPRMALLSLFVLAVMRWNINFSRNGFPTVQMPLYMFGTIAFLIYAIHGSKLSKKWPFYAMAFGAGTFFILGVFPFVFFSYFAWVREMHLQFAILTVFSTLVPLAYLVYLVKSSKNREPLLAILIAVGFFAAGAYTYQAYKVFPLLILLYGLYEVISNFKLVRTFWKEISLFAVLSIVFCLPVIFNPNSREHELMVQGVKQFLQVVGRTAIMFNRQGDPNARHNLQDYRMLDDISGALFVLGIVYSLFRVRRRKYFYTVVGFLVMSLPCILSVDAAHANRLFALTPFIAFFVAVPLSAVWARAQNLWGKKGEWVFLILLAPFLLMMTTQNFDVYFNKQAKSFAGWHEYAPQQTMVGRIIQKNGGSYNYYVSPDYYNYYTIDFLGYFYQKQTFPLLLPDSIISHSADNSRGLYFAMEEGKTGFIPMLQYFYPGGHDEYMVDPAGNTVEYFYKVPAEEVAKVRGLRAHFDREVGGKTEQQLNQFPLGLPQGPYHATLTGHLYVDVAGNYQWVVKADFPATFKVGRTHSSAPFQTLIKGYYPVKVDVDVPKGIVPNLQIEQVNERGVPTLLDAGSFDSLPPFRGLKGSYFRGPNWTEVPYLSEYDSILNYTNGNDFTMPANAIHWNGKFNVTAAGHYLFFLQTDSQRELKIDGKTLTVTGGQNQEAYLTKGTHTLDVYVWRLGSNLSNFTLYWVKPDGKREVMPTSVFGEVP